MRRLIGYERYSSKEALEQLNRVYCLVRSYVNFFQPVMQLRSKTRHGAKVQYTQEIQFAGQTAIVSGVQRELVWERGWAPRWLYSLSLGLAIPFGTSWLLLAGLFAVLIGGAWAGRLLSRWRSNPILLQAIGAAWVLLIPMIVLLQLGVSSSHWESAFLDLLVFAVGGFFSFFIGLGLALGAPLRTGLYGSPPSATSRSCALPRCSSGYCSLRSSMTSSDLSAKRSATSTSYIES